MSATPKLGQGQQKTWKVVPNYLKPVIYLLYNFTGKLVHLYQVLVPQSKKQSKRKDGRGSSQKLRGQVGHSR